MTLLSPDTQGRWDSLRAVLSETLERKRRLEHYAVLWQVGKRGLIGTDGPGQSV
ncbi:hypothetical protein ACOJCM_10125 [Billgrantia sp. LNSP4103-1]|uniref:hypothetical protein n=1 Tax=Billgrantia sp. LNSP4103-1 TaxID=3410266 RepID=UPI00403F4445